MSVERQTLEIMDENHISYKVEPLVIMSILDHYKRRPVNQSRVIGTLLGVRQSDHLVTIHSSFPIPHNERDDHVAVIDMEYHSAMARLQARVSPNLVVVGWYSSGGAMALSPSSITIDKSFQTLISSTISYPVMLVVDTTLESSKLAIKAYHPWMITSIKNKAPVVGVFDELDLQLITSCEDKIGIDALIQSQPDDDTFDSPATLLTGARGLGIALENLHGMLADVGEYVDRVVSGEMEEDREIGMMLATCISQVPGANGPGYERAFNDMVSDHMSINYLTALTKAQLAIADKVNLVA